ncbi:hypothetical protein HK101_001531, partial [Irineochytrium annulatum]
LAESAQEADRQAVRELSTAVWDEARRRMIDLDEGSYGRRLVLEAALGGGVAQVDGSFEDALHALRIEDGRPGGGRLLRLRTALLQAYTVTAKSVAADDGLRKSLAEKAVVLMEMIKAEAQLVGGKPLRATFRFAAEVFACVAGADLTAGADSSAVVPYGQDTFVFGLIFQIATKALMCGAAASRRLFFTPFVDFLIVVLLETMVTAFVWVFCAPLSSYVFVGASVGVAVFFHPAACATITWQAESSVAHNVVLAVASVVIFLFMNKSYRPNSSSLVQQVETTVFSGILLLKMGTNIFWHTIKYAVVFRVPQLWMYYLSSVANVLLVMGEHSVSVYILHRKLRQKVNPGADEEISSAPTQKEEVVASAADNVCTQIRNICVLTTVNQVEADAFEAIDLQDRINQANHAIKPRLFRAGNDLLGRGHTMKFNRSETTGSTPDVARSSTTAYSGLDDIAARQDIERQLSTGSGKDAGGQEFKPHGAVIAFKPYGATLHDLAATPTRASFVPFNEATYFGCNHICGITAEISAQTAAFFIILLFVSTPPNIAWSSYFTTIEPWDLTLRFFSTLPLLLLEGAAAMWVDARVLRIDFQKALAEVDAANLFAADMFLHAVGDTINILGSFLISDTGLFLRNPLYNPGRRKWPSTSPPIALMDSLTTADGSSRPPSSSNPSSPTSLKPPKRHPRTVQSLLSPSLHSTAVPESDDTPDLFDSMPASVLGSAPSSPPNPMLLHVHTAAPTKKPSGVAGSRRPLSDRVRDDDEDTLEEEDIDGAPNHKNVFDEDELDDEADPALLSPRPVDPPSRPLRVRPGRFSDEAALRTRSLPNENSRYRTWSVALGLNGDDGDDDDEAQSSRAARRSSMFATARKITRAQMRGMATMAAAAATVPAGGEELMVTPASALVELGGSGKVHVEEEEGSSTLQSIFNTVNLLLGLGLLSLPYAMRCGGWIPTLGLLIVTAFMTAYTAYILSRCLALQPGRLFDFADIGEAAFGPKSRSFISVLFISELFFTCVAFVILISDSLHALFPDISVEAFRVVAFVICTGSTFVRQLKYISYASLVGIVASCNLVVVVLFDGFTKTERPGSLIDPEPTFLLPDNPIAVSLSFGIVMAGFAGHAVLPNIYLDLRDKSKFPKVLGVSFSIALCFYCLIASAGYLMFGDFTLEEVTKNLAMAGSSVNPNLNIVTTWLITFIPVPKFALTMAPVALALDQYVGFLIRKHYPDLSTDTETANNTAANSTSPVGHDDPHTHHHAGGHRLALTPPRWVQLLLRTLLGLGASLIPLFVPHFDVVLSLLGCIFSVSVSIVLPAACYLRLFSVRGWWGIGKDTEGEEEEEARPLLRGGSGGKGANSIGYVEAGICWVLVVIGSLTPKLLLSCHIMNMSTAVVIGTTVAYRSRRSSGATYVKLTDHVEWGGVLTKHRSMRKAMVREHWLAVMRERRRKP